MDYISGFLFLWFVFGYLVLIWGVLRLAVPHFGFKRALPDTVAEDFMATIADIDSRASDNRDFLQKCFEYVTSKYTGSRLKTVTHFWVAFRDPVGLPPGFLPCTSQNYLLRLMLVKSGRFSDDDVVPTVTPLNLFIHQYLRVRVDGAWIDVDPWASFLGVPLGKKCSIIC